MGGSVKNRELILWGTAVEAGNREDYGVEEGRRKLRGEIGMCRTRAGVLHRGCGDWITHPIVYSISSMAKRSRAHWLSCVTCSSRQNTFLLPGELRRASQFLLFFTTFWPAPPWSSFSMVWFLGENECRFLVSLTNASQKQQRPEVCRQFSEPWGFSE